MIRDRLRVLALLAAAVLIVAGCAASPTPFGPAGDDGFGYREQQIEGNRYRVSFAGNTATSREMVENAVLFRAAELTLGSGHDYFTVVDQDIEAQGSGVASPQVGIGMGSGGFGVGVSSVVGGGSTSARYTAYADILMFDGEKPAEDLQSYDARDLIERLRPSLVLG